MCKNCFFWAKKKHFNFLEIFSLIHHQQKRNQSGILKVTKKLMISVNNLEAQYEELKRKINTLEQSRRKKVMCYRKMQK